MKATPELDRSIVRILQSLATEVRVFVVLFLLSSRKFGPKPGV
jgi:hypothetical protein